jgi:hypothetical protein
MDGLTCLKQLYLHEGGRLVSYIFLTVCNPLSYGWLSGVKFVALLAIGAQVASIFLLSKLLQAMRYLPGELVCIVLVYG